MGQNLSEHELFTKGVSEALRVRGIKVTPRQLTDYFSFINKVCPWFPLEGTINIRVWDRVGDALQDYYRVFGPEKVPVTAFAYWTLISELLRTQPNNLQPSQAPAQPLGQPVAPPITDTPIPSPPPSVVLQMPEEKDGRCSPTSPVPTSAFFNDSHPPSYETDLRPPSCPGSPPFDGLSSCLKPTQPPALYPPLPDPPPFSLPPQIPLPSAPPPPLVAPAFSVNFPSLHPAPTATPMQDQFLSSLLERISLLERKAQQDHLNYKLSLSQPSPKLHAYPITEVQQAPTAEGQPAPPPQRARVPFPLNSLKELKMAVTQYGPTATFTLAVHDSLSQGWVTPNEHKELARAALSGGDFLLWKSNFLDQCEIISKQNQERQPPNPVTFAMLSGTGDFCTDEQQMGLNPQAFAQISLAASRAWRKLPSKGEGPTSLTKIRQGPTEPFSDFIGRLTEAADRIFGEHENNNSLIRQLAFENANPTCQDIIRPHRHTGSIEQLIRLCADFGPSYQQGVMFASALENTLQKVLSLQIAGPHDNKKPPAHLRCFKCHQPGHFSKSCPLRTATPLPSLPQPSGLPQSSLPPSRPPPQTICPKCRKGFHWANECKSRYTVDGHPIPKNFSGGPPQAPISNPLLTQGTTESTHNPSTLPTSSRQHLPARDLTSVPPPPWY